ncbi:MAG: hypothetical protein ACRD8Z_11010 [Nitrososphaeraceae archaeon]
MYLENEKNITKAKMYLENEKNITSEIYSQAESGGLSVAKVLNAISDEWSWSLFTTIAISSDPTSNRQQLGDGGQILISRMNLTRRQYYQRINRLRSLGLINRKNGRYSLTSFGRVLYETQKTIEIAIQNQWRLAALDLLESSFSAKGMPVEDRIKLVNVLLTDCDEIKNMLLCNNNDGSSKTKSE